MDKLQQQLIETVNPLIEEAVSSMQTKVQKSIDMVSQKLDEFKKTPVTLSTPIDFRTKQAIDNYLTYPIVHSIVDGATATNYDVFFTADYPCEVISVSETHRVLGTDGGSVTLNIEKLTSGQALGAGSNILTTALSLKTTINTPQFGSLVSTSARVLSKGDRLALVDSGTLTAVAGVTVTIYIRRI